MEMETVKMEMETMVDGDGDGNDGGNDGGGNGDDEGN